MELATLTALSERGRESRRQKEDGKGELTATTGHGSFNPPPCPSKTTVLMHTIRAHFLNGILEKIITRTQRKQTDTEKFR